jgi:hypothetical protein
MNRKEVTYAERQRLIKEFFDQQERGSHYQALMQYLTELSIEVPEDNTFFIGGPLGKLVQDRKLEKILVSKDVFEGYFGIKWKGEKEKSLCKVYFSPKYTSGTGEIMALQKKWERSKNIERGMTPSLMQRIADGRLFEIIQECTQGEEYLDVVVIEKIRHTEESINLRRAQAEKSLKEADKLIEDTVVNFIQETYKDASEIRKIIEETRKKAEATRKKLQEENASQESST